MFIQCFYINIKLENTLCLYSCSFPPRAASLVVTLVTDSSNRKSQAFLLTAMFQLFKKLSHITFKEALNPPGIVYYCGKDFILRLQIYFPHIARSAWRDSNANLMKLVGIEFPGLCLSESTSFHLGLRFLNKDSALFLVTVRGSLYLPQLH